MMRGLLTGRTSLNSQGFFFLLQNTVTLQIFCTFYGTYSWSGPFRAHFLLWANIGGAIRHGSPSAPGAVCYFRFATEKNPPAKAVIVVSHFHPHCTSILDKTRFCFALVSLRKAEKVEYLVQEPQRLQTLQQVHKYTINILANIRV